jgi:hypothetical protein
MCEWSGVICCNETYEVAAVTPVLGMNGTRSTAGVVQMQNVSQISAWGLEPCSHGLIAGLDVAASGLTGTLPAAPFRALAPTLQLFFGYNNALEGALPDTFQEMDRLEIILLNGNAFTGDLPLLPRSLRTVSLARNQLTVRGPPVLPDAPSKPTPAHLSPPQPTPALSNGRS